MPPVIYVNGSGEGGTAHDLVHRPGIVNHSTRPDLNQCPVCKYSKSVAYGGVRGDGEIRGCHDVLESFHRASFGVYMSGLFPPIHVAMNEGVSVT